MARASSRYPARPFLVHPPHPPPSTIFHQLPPPPTVRVRHSMRVEGIGIGSINTSYVKRRELSDRSGHYNRRDANFQKLFVHDDRHHDHRHHHETVDDAPTDPGAGPAVPPPAERADLALLALKGDLLDNNNRFEANCDREWGAADPKPLPDPARSGHPRGGAPGGDTGGRRESEGVGALSSTVLPKPKLLSAGPKGNKPGMVVDALCDVDRIMQVAADGDIVALADEVRRTPHAVHAIRRDGKTPAIVAALGKHVACLVFLVERGAAFKHHGTATSTSTSRWPCILHSRPPTPLIQAEGVDVEAAVLFFSFFSLFSLSFGTVSYKLPSAMPHDTRRPTMHACDVLYLAPMLIGC